MKLLLISSRFAAALLLGLILPSLSTGRAATILQTTGSSAIAWEAENYGTHLNDPLMVTVPSPAEVWAPTNDATASGGMVLSALGENITAFPASYVDYRLQFATPGSYRLYIRAKADAVFASADRFTANSSWIPLRFGTPFTTNTPDSEAHYVRSAMNASDAQATPSSTNFVVYAEPPTFDVTQAMVDSREVVVLRIGTRERGVIMDRLVLSTDPALSEGGFSATPNSDVDIFVQSAAATHIAFEAETPKATFFNDPLMVTVPSPAEVWAPTNDATASGGMVLSALGENITAFPASYVDYRLQFATPGSYRLYIRAKADAVFASADRFTANSSWIPLRFGTPFTTNTPDSEAHYVRSAMNASDAQATPSSTNFVVYAEPPTFDVTQAMVDSREVVVLRIGTRERGVIMDRLVLSTDQALSEGGFNALPNTGVDNIAPQIVSVSGSLSFTNVTITFDEPINPMSLDVFSFQADGGLQILNIALDAATLRKLSIHTSSQTPGANYTITFSGLTDVSGNSVPPDSQAAFQAWRLQTGWVTREIYNAVPGSTVADLTAAAKFPDSPDSIDAFNGMNMENSPRLNNYGMRLRCFFIPPVTGTYEFYVYADDQAEVSLSTDETPASLMPLVTTPAPSSSFSPAVKGGLPFDSLVAGQRYLLQVLLKQGAGDARLGVAAAQTTAGAIAPAALPPLIELRGNVISTYINPATASVNITKNPQNTNVTVGYNARFETAATSPAGAVAIQWQLNGVDIPGATRAVLVTPPVTLADAGKRYRAVVNAGGATAVSSEAVLGVNPGQPPTAQPYIGINFVGGGGAVEGFISASDIAGAVPQANFNNIDGAAQTAAPLNDAAGNLTTATISYAAAIRYTGTGNRTADDALFEGYIQNNTAAMTVTLNGVPAGSYGLLAYCVGFDFQTIYDQGYELIGAVTYPAFHVRGQTASEYRNSPGYRRMSSTDPNARESGNYVMFENVAPDATGTFTLNLTFEMMGTPGVTDSTPALNALQLVRLAPPLPALGLVRNANGTVTISWDAAAVDYTLKSTASLGPSPAPVWTTVSGSPTPITSAGSVTVNATANQYFRLEK